MDNELIWWELLHLPILNAVIMEGLSTGHQVKIIEQRLLQAEALLKQGQSSGLPELNFNLGGNAGLRDDGNAFNRISAGLGGRWRLDTNRAIHHSVRAREFAVQGLRNEVEQASLVLSVEIANAMVDWITQERLLQLLDDQQAFAESSLRVVNARFQQGVATRLDVLQQEGLLAEIRVQRPSVLAERKRLQLRIIVLSGKDPLAPWTLEPVYTLPDVAERPHIGSPLELLNARPDLRALRFSVLTADSEAARAWAERWPALTLDFEAIWREGRSLSEGVMSVGANLLQPLFDGGRRRSEFARSTALREERWLTLNLAYLSALALVEELVYAENQSDALLLNLREREALLVEAEAQADSRYTQGLTDFLPVITARQDLLNIRQRILREQRNRLRLRIALHAALGGPMPAPATQS